MKDLLAPIGSAGWWFKLPLALRRRWWAETDYGKNPPSEELMQAIRDALDAKKE